MDKIYNLLEYNLTIEFLALLQKYVHLNASINKGISGPVKQPTQYNF